MDFIPSDSFAPSPGDIGAEDKLDPMDAFASSPGPSDENSDNSEGPAFEPVTGMEAEDSGDSDGPEFEPIEEEDEEEKEHRPSPSGVNVVDKVPSSSNSAATPETLSEKDRRMKEFIITHQRCSVCNVPVTSNPTLHIKGRKHRKACQRAEKDRPLDAAEIWRIMMEEHRCPLCKVALNKGKGTCKSHLKGRKHRAALQRKISQAAPSPKNVPSQAKRSDASAPTPTEGSEQSEEPLEIDMLDSGSLKKLIISIQYCPLCDIFIAAANPKGLSQHISSRKHQGVLNEQTRIAGMQQQKDSAEDAELEDGPMGTRILLGKGADYLPDNLRECLSRCRCRICPDPFTSRSGPDMVIHYNSTKHQAELRVRGLPTGVFVTTAPISHRRQSTGRLVVQVPAVHAIIRVRIKESNQEVEENEFLRITSFKGEGVSDLPEELLRLFKTKHCSRCKSTFSKVTEALKHFNQTSHQVELMRQELPARLVKLTGPLTVERTSDDTGVLVVPKLEKSAALSAIEKFTGEGAADMPLTLRLLYMSGNCPLCDVSFVHSKHAIDHYNCSKHQRQLEKGLLPIGCVAFAIWPDFSKATGDRRVLMVPKMTSPPSRVKRLTGEGAPNLPENLCELILTRFCRLCSLPLYGDVLMHFNQGSHQARLEEQGLPYGTVHLDGPLRPFTSEEGEQLVEVPKVSTPPKPKPAILTGPGVKDLPENAAELIHFLYCTHCCYTLMMEQVAFSHYNCARHQSKLKKAKLPFGNVCIVGRMEVTTNADGERVVHVPPISSGDSPFQRLGGEGAKDVPDNLRELLLSFHCRLCTMDLYSVDKVFRHYNSPSHMVKMARAQLPQVRAALTGAYSQKTVDGESVLVLPPIEHEQCRKKFKPRPRDK